MAALLAASLALHGLLGAQPAREPLGPTAPPAVEPDRPYTSARLDQATMERLVARPLRLIRRGDIGGAERAFARLLAAQSRGHGPASLVVADHVMAFGAILFHEAPNVATRRLAISYMRRAADAYTAALGRNHREVALVLADIGNAWLAISPDDPPPEAQAALEEAYAIRRDTLGPNNVETASSLLQVAHVRGLPSRTRGDPARIEASAALFREAIRDFGPRRVVPGLHGAITGWFDLAEMYLRNGLPEEAVEAATAARDNYRSVFPGDRLMCEVLIRREITLASRLRREGHRAAAARVESQDDGAAPDPCLNPLLPRPPRS